MYLPKNPYPLGNEILEVRGMSKTYPPNITALRDARLRLLPGSVTALLGPNGAGKTTLVNCVIGLVRPDEGTVTYGDLNLLRNPKLAGHLFGLVFEEVDNVYGYLTIRENIMYFGYLNGLDKRTVKDFMAWWLPKTGLEEKLAVPGFQLSRGMKQKLALVIALLKNPPVLILDEPSLGLDVLSRQHMMTVVKDLASKEQKAVLLTTHDMPLAQELADEYYFIDHGRILLSGSRDALREKFGQKPLEEVFRDVIMQEAL